MALAPESLRSRLAGGDVPLVLAGPILRRVDASEVTVFVALRDQCTVRLRVFESGDASGEALLSGSRSTVPLGAHLHVVAVTATGTASLAPDRLYSYDMDFGDDLTLDAAGVVTMAAGGLARLAYPGTTHPTFSLPPLDLNDVRIVHGSCRKPHAPGPDALAAVDGMISAAAATGDRFAVERPHQLFLTGDQIYGDDVADSLLEMVSEAGDTLLGWEEPLPALATTPSSIPPGTRQTIVSEAKLTSDHARSHLLGLGEYYAMYLFVWADTVWPTEIPETGDRDDRDRLAVFRATLPEVRRALANVATYMIFDDHEVTDDWYLNRRWCVEGVPADEPGGALAHPLGRRIIGNGLAAYAIFQAWGNTPDQFGDTTAGEPGRSLLAALARWSESGGHDADQRLVVDERTGLGPALTEADDALVRATGALRWHYAVAGPDDRYEVVVLDSRTMRGYPSDAPEWSSAALLSPEAFADQLGSLPPVPRHDGFTIVVAPAPVLGIPFPEKKQAVAATTDGAFASDTEAWSLDEATLQRLLGWLAARRARVVLLSGDVHYTFAARLSYRATHPSGQARQPSPIDCVIGQLTSSALHNESYAHMASLWNIKGRLATTDRMHRGGYNQFYLRRHIEIAPPDQVMGWHVPDGDGSLVVGSAVGDSGTDPLVLTAPAVLHSCDNLPTGTVVTAPPDWEYDVAWLPGSKDTDLSPPDPIVPFTGSEQQREKRLNDYREFYEWAVRDDMGQDIVGRNNVGSLRFTWTDGGNASVSQQLWWTPDANAPLAPITSHMISFSGHPLPSAS